MKTVSLLVLTGLAGFTLASCNREAPAAPDQAGGASSPPKTESLAPEALPRMKAGLWKVDSQMQSPMGTVDLPSQTMCQTADIFQSPQVQEVQPGVECTPANFKRDGDRLSGAMTCKGEGIEVASTITMTGDFETRYQTVVHNRITPAPGPGMGETTLRLNAVRVGDCPAE